MRWYSIVWEAGDITGVTQLVECVTFNHKVRGSIPLTGISTFGKGGTKPPFFWRLKSSARMIEGRGAWTVVHCCSWVPEWLKGADLRSAAFASWVRTPPQLSCLGKGIPNNISWRFSRHCLYRKVFCSLSSVGRASVLWAESREFDPPSEHLEQLVEQNKSDVV